MKIISHKKSLVVIGKDNNKNDCFAGREVSRTIDYDTNTF